MQHVSIHTLREQIEVLFRSWGMPEATLTTTAEAMVYADASGIDSHGISMLMKYDSLLTQGKLNVVAKPHIITETPAIAVMDADAGLGHPAAVEAMDLAADKARNLGIGAVAVFNSHHFGATGYYAARAAGEGLVALVTTTAGSVAVIPTGGALPQLSTNPVAFAALSSNGSPLVLDMSTSTVAMNKVKTYALNEAQLPEGWVLDETGASITDSQLAYDYLRFRREGGLAPLGGSTTATGGHKGYGLSMMVQILSAGLSGAALPGGGTERGDNIGHFFLALDPEAFGGTAGDYTADLIAMMHSTEPADPDQPAQVPGEPEARMREVRAEAGVPMPEMLAGSIREICARNGAAFLLE